MKNKHCNKIIVTLIVIILLLGLIVVGHFASKSNTSDLPDKALKTSLKLTEEEWKEIEDAKPTKEVEDMDHIDEWFDDYEIVHYGDTEVKRYAEEYGASSPNEQIVEYFWYNLEQYANVAGEYDYSTCVLETRTDNLYRLNTYNTENYYVYIEIEQDKEDRESEKWSGNFYIKLTDSEGSDPLYYIASLVLNKEKSEDKSVYYDIEVVKAEYNDVKNIVENFSDQPNEMANNRAYAEYVLNGLKETIAKNTDGRQTEFYYEGYSGPVDVDMMMRILGYADEN